MILTHEKAMTEAAFLAQYDIHQFDVPLLSVDIVVFSVLANKLHVLLVHRKAHPEMGKWALPGGFLDLKRDVDLHAAAARKLAEKTGVRGAYLEQLQTVGNQTRDPRGWSATVVYFSLIGIDQIRADTLADDAAWVPIDDPRLKELAFDHIHLFGETLKHLRRRVEHTALPMHLLPEAFTISELKRVYELILMREVEKSAFRRRIKDADIMEPIPGEKRQASNRPAQLYRIKKGKGNYFFLRTPW